MSDELNWLSAREMARRFADGSVSPVDVLEATLKQLHTVNPALNAICLLDEPQGRRMMHHRRVRPRVWSAKSSVQAGPSQAFTSEKSSVQTSCARVASSTSTGDRSPLAKRRAISRAESQFKSSDMPPDPGCGEAFERSCEHATTGIGPQPFDQNGRSAPPRMKRGLESRSQI